MLYSAMLYSATEALDFVRAHDWKGDYSCHEIEQQRFISEADAMLAELAG